ncbi:MAG: DUF1343 domain-containing protein, partial [Hyphomonadaceae bacterium]|nr:DUF1343 domain-containing protein [Hyphomonadaceae bacterium]
VPIRHGMSLGELAGLMNSDFAIGCDLTVVRSEGWRRGDHAGATGLPWVMPSPNMPTPDTALVYPGTCLLEGTNLSEGRGTTRPFEIVGAPFIDGLALANALNRLALPGVRWRPQSFTPSFSKHAGMLCGGVQVHITNRRAYAPVATGIVILSTIAQMHVEDFAFLPGTPPFFDRLAGTDWLREAITSGVSLTAMVDRWQPGLDAFMTQRAGHLLY